MSADETIRHVLSSYRTIAVYGMSRDPEKPSRTVPKHMLVNGFKIIPLNPGSEKIMGHKSYARLEDVPDEIEILDVFRPSGSTPDIVREAVARRKERGDIHVIWLQEGISNEESRELAEEAGITFVQDLCIWKEYSRLFLQDA